MSRLYKIYHYKIILYLFQDTLIMARIYIKPLWLSYLNLTTRPSNQFYATNDVAKAAILELKKKIGLQKQNDVTLHHILPGNSITNIIEQCRSDQDSSKVQKTCDLLGNHCSNKPEIGKKVQFFIDKQDYHNAIDSCWSSVFWFRRNLVLGPKEDRRSDDPGQNFDAPLFNQQSKNFQDLLNACRSEIQNKKWNNALEIFLGLPPTVNVIWTFDTKKQKWSVTGKSSQPGNVGFDYY